MELMAENSNNTNNCKNACWQETTRRTWRTSQPLWSNSQTQYWHKRLLPGKKKWSVRENVKLNINLDYSSLKIFKLPGGTKRASTQTILFAALQNSQHCCKVLSYSIINNDYEETVSQTRSGLKMKDNENIWFFKLDYNFENEKQPEKIIFQTRSGRIENNQRPSMSM